jgi:hypothetical protein
LFERVAVLVSTPRFKMNRSAPLGFHAFGDFERMLGGPSEAFESISSGKVLNPPVPGGQPTLVLDFNSYLGGVAQG